MEGKPLCIVSTRVIPNQITVFLVTEKKKAAPKTVIKVDLASDTSELTITSCTASQSYITVVNNNNNNN